MSSLVLHLVMLAALMGMLFQRPAAESGSADRIVQVSLIERSSADADSQLDNDPKLETRLRPDLREDSPEFAVSAIHPSAVPPADSQDRPFMLLDLGDPTAPERPFDSAARWDAAAALEVAGGFRPIRRGGEATEQELIRDELDRLEWEARQPAGPPAQLQVFGSRRLTGQSFVFVIDRSASMGGGGLGVIERAADELSAALSTLREDQSFQIIAYHHQALPLMGSGLVRARPQTTEQVRNQVNALAAFGGTDHQRALYLALSMRPDIIVLLTDGGDPQLDRGAVEALRRANTGRSEIHCIMFGDGQRGTTGDFLLDLAAQNGGSFQYIDVRGWR